MKVVILAGGLGSRLSEETSVRPKPMVEIGGRPILWHIMKYYSHFGLNDFIICLGYRGYMIKEYFANYMLHLSDVTIDVRENSIQVHRSYAEPWKVTLIDTGDTSMTGGRLRRVRAHLDGDFCMTYGDGLADLDVNRLVQFHRRSGLDATVTGVYPPGRFGALVIEEDKVVDFQEKPRGDGGFINGGFFVLSPKVLDLIDADETVWEQGPMQSLASSGRLGVYEHLGFWHAMDTLRDKNHLEHLWQTGEAPWKLW